VARAGGVGDGAQHPLRELVGDDERQMGFREESRLEDAAPVLVCDAALLAMPDSLDHGDADVPGLGLDGIHHGLDAVADNIRLEKSVCDGAPYYVLGPLVTDIAPGYDHITSAIGGAIAAAAGADFLCYVTPAEHLRLPSVEDVKEGVIASRIAAHAADIVKLGVRAKEWDNEMSRARKERNWEKMFAVAIDSVKARAYRSGLPSGEEDQCSMCGEFCAMKRKY